MKRLIPWLADGLGLALFFGAIYVALVVTAAFDHPVPV